MEVSTIIRKNLLAACIAGLSAAVGGQVAAKDLTEVVVGTAVVSINSSMLTAAMELGYFEEEGLKFRFNEFAGASVVMTQVATKGVPIGGGGLGTIVTSNQPGKTPLPIKFFYNQSRDDIWEMLTLPNGSVKTYADLKGKKIGVGALLNGHMPVTRVILKDFGLVEGKDYQFVPVGVGGPAFKALLDGQIDAYYSWIANTAGYETLPGSVKFHRLESAARYKTIPSNAYFAHVDTIKNNPEILVGFGRAIAKATVFCQIAMDYCIKSYWKLRPNLTPREGTVDENAKRLVPSMMETWKTFLAFPPGVPRRFGDFPKESWDNLVTIMNEGGELPAKYDPSSLYTNELVDKINDFDVAAIEKQAQGYK